MTKPASWTFAGPVRPPLAAALGLLLLILLGAGWWLRPAAFLAAWLAAWWFWTGLALGSVANVWLHDLTGGAWGEAIREPLLRFSRTFWIAAPLFLPILLGMQDLFPWAAQAADGAARWSGELSAPGFKNAWLSPDFFIVRSIGYLLVWSALVYLSQPGRMARVQGFSAAALIVYGGTVGLASVDWLMSLMPLWKSSIFGWLVGVGQMLGGMALGTVFAARRAKRPGGIVSASLFRDLGNLMLMYVMSWAYLGFSQFLIIWAENLPHEISWYIPRSQGVWLAVAWLLSVGLFALPLLILLSRHAKQMPGIMAWLARLLLLMQCVNTCWLVLPSLPIGNRHWLWALPLCGAAMLASCALAWHWSAYRETEEHHA